MMFPKGLHGFDKPTILLSKGEVGTWEECGVRDPAILMDTDGNPALIGGKMVMYYTGSRDHCSVQSTGCALSSDNGETWVKYENNPILSPISNSWESKITSTPWAIKLDNGQIYMYYRGSTGYPGGADSIGLAISRDGVSFERYDANPIITPKQFEDIADENPVMGVINCVILQDGQFLLTFEAVSKKYNTGQIYGAISNDGVKFFPLNGGFPFFESSILKNWKVARVCNPRVTVYGSSLLLGFNGFLHNGHWAIGFIAMENMKTWIEYPLNPVLIPTQEPVESPFSGRLEGPVLTFKDHQKTHLDKMFFMAIPRKGPSHMGSVIASVKFSGNKCMPEFIRTNCLFDGDINMLSENTLSFKRKNEKYNKLFLLGSHSQKYIVKFDKISEGIIYTSDEYADDIDKSELVIEYKNFNYYAAKKVDSIKSLIQRICNKNKKAIVIYGYGLLGKKTEETIVNQYKKIQIEYIVDDNVNFGLSKFNNRIVKNISSDNIDFYIVTACSYENIKLMKSRLINNGIIEEKILVINNEFEKNITLLSNMKNVTDYFELKDNALFVKMKKWQVGNVVLQKGELLIERIE